MDETDALPAGIATAETADGGSGYRIACAALLGAAVLSGLYAALILAGVLEKRCWLLETTGRECIACGCTRDFARLLSGRAPQWNPLSGLYFALVCAEIAWRIAGVAVRRMPRSAIRADILVHAVLIGWILASSLLRIAGP